MRSQLPTLLLIGLVSCTNSPDPVDTAPNDTAPTTDSGDTGTTDSGDSGTTDTGDSGDTGEEPPEPSVTFDLVEAAFAAHPRNTWSMGIDDVDHDGHLDVFVNNHADPPTLWLGDGAANFVDGVVTAITPTVAADDHGLLFADIDRDGDRDLVQTTGASPSQDMPHRLWSSNGGKLFPNALNRARQPGARGRAPLALDVDGDGQLELYMRNAARSDGQQPSQLFAREDDFWSEHDYVAPTGNYGFDALLDADADGDIDWLQWRWGSPTRVELPGLASTVDDTMFLANARAIVGFDADGDGDGELLVVRAHGDAVPELRQPTDDSVWLGMRAGSDSPGIDITGGQQITVEAWFERDETPQWSIGAIGPISWSLGQLLLDRDSLAEGEPMPVSEDQSRIWVGRTGDTWHFRLVGNSATRIALHIEADEDLSDVQLVRATVPSPAPEATLLTHDGTGWVAASGGPTTGPYCVDAVPGDFDNDGDVDVFFTCGSHTRNEPDQLWLNDGSGVFSLADANSDGPLAYGRSFHAAVADFDENGSLDLVLSGGSPEVPEGGAAHWMLLNQGNDNHWLRLGLTGTDSGTDAIGARVELEAGGKTQVRWHTGGQDDGVQHERFQHFGLGATETVDKLTIYWPSGTVTEHTDLDADSLYEVIEPPQ